MEIYRGQPVVKEFNVPSNAQSISAVIRYGTTTTPAQNLTKTGTIVNVGIPYAAVRSDGGIEIDLRFFVDNVSYTDTKYASVITPVLPQYKVIEITGDAANAVDAETMVRKIIESYTGVSFGYYVGAKIVYGNPHSGILLPEPLISITSVNSSTFYIGSYSVISNQLFVSTDSDYLTIKQAPPEEGYMTFPGLIKTPKTLFARNESFTIEGEWGYRNVPADVQQAAALLLNDYACAESIYQDKYLSAATSADWRIDFQKFAYEGTGNFRADQLLEKYKPLGWDVI